MTSRFDHLQHWVPRLDDAIDAYRAAGFPIAIGGVHPGRGTHNAQWESAPHFIELIAVRDATEAQQGWRSAWPQIARILGAGGGAGRFAVEADALPPVVARLRAAGLHPRDPIGGSIRHPDGVVATWSLAPLLDAPPWAPFFTNYGDTPEARRRGRRRERSPWRIRVLRIAAPDPDGGAAWLATALDVPRSAPRRVTFGDVMFEFAPGNEDRIVGVGLEGDGAPTVTLLGLRYESFRP